MQQRSQQSNAIKSRREIEGVVRIGDRDPVTGRYEVLEPDGGVDPNGIKVFNSQEQYGDRVLPFRRLDGAIGLDSEKGSKVRTPTAFPKCPGYLASQVFNCEEPKPVKKDGKIWILFLYNNQLYVGGHKQAPELIYNPIPPEFAPDSSFSAFPLNVQANIQDIKNMATIWGDDQGWEASYGVNNPVPSVGFAIEGASKNSPSYTRNGNDLQSNSRGRLGKGLFLRYDRVFNNSGGGNYGESWKNTIADFDGAPKGSGSDQFTSVLVPFVSNTTGRTIVETYPAPHSNKGVNFVAEDRNAAVGPSTMLRSWTNSCEIIYRDRFQALFSRFNASASSGTLEYIVSDGKKDTILFSIGTSGSQNQETLRPYIAGISNRPTFNFPFVTDLGDVVPSGGSFGTKYIHFNEFREYKVRVYDVYSKSSLIDGIFEEVTVSAWGIPPGSRILDTASYVEG